MLVSSKHRWSGSGQERSFQIKKDITERDRQGVFILPVITIERTGLTKDLGKKGKFWANVPRS